MESNTYKVMVRIPNGGGALFEARLTAPDVWTALQMAKGTYGDQLVGTAIQVYPGDA